MAKNASTAPAAEPLTRLAAEQLLALLNEYYSDPENEAAYQKWRIEKNEKSGG